MALPTSRRSFVLNKIDAISPSLLTRKKAALKKSNRQRRSLMRELSGDGHSRGRARFGSRSCNPEDAAKKAESRVRHGRRENESFRRELGSSPPVRSRPGCASVFSAARFNPAHEGHLHVSLVGG